MPEGPSIVILKEKVAHLKHEIVSEALGYADMDMADFAGRKIMDFKSWGKHFLICFSDFTIRIHFGLFGSYQLHEPKKANPKIALYFNNDSLYFYVCTLKRIEQPLDEVYDWSVDVMGDGFSVDKALKKLEKLPDRMICDVLLDQNIFAGVGNIIKNEVLYRCGTHPESVIGKIPAAKLKSIVEESRNYSFDFLRWRKVNQLSRHYEVYKQGTARTSGEDVKRKDTGKTKRISFFVEKEQKLFA